MSEKPMTVLRSMNKVAKLRIFYIAAPKFPRDFSLLHRSKVAQGKLVFTPQQLFFKTFGDGETFVYFCALKIHDGQRR